jgi:hypothetical protein
VFPKFVQFRLYLGGPPQLNGVRLLQSQDCFSVPLDQFQKVLILQSRHIDAPFRWNGAMTLYGALLGHYAASSLRVSK